MKNKICIIETVATLIHDNISNIIIIVIAKNHFHIELTVSLQLWAVAQLLNILFSYSRRMFFHSYQYQIIRMFSKHEKKG